MASAHQAGFDRWRARHPEHQRVYDRLLRRWDEASVLGLSAQFPTPERRRADHGARRLSWPNWAAAPLLAASLAALLFLSPVRPDWVDFWPVPSMWSQRIATDVGQIRSVRLADGSSVILDTDSIVVSHLSGSARRLSLLRGRARFDVAHDTRRPFIVVAAEASVTARGTLFDVSLSPDRKVAVTLIRGVVDVKGPIDTALPHPGQRTAARLVAGQQIAFGRGEAASKAHPAPPAGAPWPEGLLTFETTPLSEAVEEANRYSRRQIQLAAPALGTLQVSGVFRATAPRAFADSLAAAFDLRVKDEPDGNLMLLSPDDPGA